MPGDGSLFINAQEQSNIVLWPHYKTIAFISFTSYVFAPRGQIDLI